MPTLQELKQAYPDLSDADLTTRWQTKHPNEPLTDAAPAAAEASPSIMDRLKSAGRFVTSPEVLSGVGQYGADALATAAGQPELIPIAGAAGSVLGGMASHLIHGDSMSGSEMGWDAATGAAAPFIGKGLKAGAAGLRYIGDAIPNAAKALAYGGGVFTGHPAVLGIEAATNPKLLPRAMDAMGDAANWAGKKLMAPFVPAAEEEGVSPLVRRATAQVNKATGVSREVPYRAGSGISTPESVNAIDSVAGPKYPPLQSGDAAGSVNDMMTNQKGLDSMHEGFAQNRPLVDKMAIEGQFDRHPSMKGDALARRASFNKITPELVEPGAPPSSAGQSNGTMGEVDAYLQKLGLGQKAESIRPAADYVHPADTSFEATRQGATNAPEYSYGGKYDNAGGVRIEGIPEISEGELTRLQQSMGRMKR